MITLARKHTLKKLNETKKRVEKVELTLRENDLNRNVNLLLEALDADEYQKATQIIEQLQNISSKVESIGLKQIPQAIDNCIKDINEFTGGGIAQRAKSKLASLASLFSKEAPAKNPIMKGLSLASALEDGFKSTGVILKNNIKDIKSKMDTSIDEIIGNDEKTKKNISNTLIKAFVPIGTFGKIFKKIPYIANEETMVQELMLLTPKQIEETFKTINSGPKASDIDTKIIDQQANKEAAAKLSSNNTKDDATGNKATTDSAQKTILVKATQDAAKKAGVSDGKALVALMKKLNYEPGSTAGTLVIPTLQELMAEKKHIR